MEQPLPDSGVANVGAAPPDPNRKNEDGAVEDDAINLDAAVADAVGAAAVAPKPQLDIDGDVAKPKLASLVQRPVDDVVDGDAEAGVDDEDGAAAGAAVAGKDAVAPEQARQEPLLEQAASSPFVKDGIDQLHNNLAADDQQRA